MTECSIQFTNPMKIQWRFTLLRVLAGIVLLIIAGIVAILMWQKSPILQRIFCTPSRCSYEPPILLWAWEYPTDLHNLDSKRFGVAFLAARAQLIGDEVELKPRVQRLKIAPDAYKVAVIRIEPDRKNLPATYTDHQAKDLATKVLSVLSAGKVDALQIDFDALQSERPFYRQVIANIRRRMPPNMPLSITALASWCIGDNWLADISCDEVVPMFFSMGRDRERMLNYLKVGKISHPARVRVSLGLSIDEPDVLSLSRYLTPHMYLFSSKGWNTANAVGILNELQKRGADCKEVSQ